MKLTIGKKIGLGFASLLAILAVSGTYAVVKMKQAAVGSRHVSDEYMPELQFTDALNAGVAAANLNARTFALSGDEQYLELARKAFTEVEAAFKQGDALAANSTQLVKLASTAEELSSQAEQLQAATGFFKVSNTTRNSNATESTILKSRGSSREPAVVVPMSISAVTIPRLPSLKDKVTL